MASRVQIKQARRVPKRKHELEQNSQYSEALSSFGSGISDNNKMTAEEQKARRSDRIKFLILALVVIAVFYFVLYQVIGYVDRVRRGKNNSKIERYHFTPAISRCHNY